MNAFNTKISSCQNTISKETNTSLYLKANKKASEASFPPRPSSLSLVPSSSFPSVPSLPPLYPLVLYSKSLIEKVIQIVPKYIQLKVGLLILKSSSPQATILINFLDILSDVVYTCAYENK